MSLLDQLKLPPLAVSESKASADAPLDDKRFIIALSRDLSDEDKRIFSQHGKVLEWGAQFLNVPFESLEFDYLLIDIRSKEARLTLSRQSLDKYHKVSYVWWIQKGVDDVLSQLESVEISSIPKHAVNRKDFEQMLLNEKLVAPSVMKSFLKLLKSCVSSA